MKRLPAGLLEEMTRRLVVALGAQRVMLFGSHAWGTPDEDSDVDLFVVVPWSDESARERAIKARHAIRDLDVPKDVVVRTVAEVERARGVPASLEAEILERGIVLYEG